MMEDESGFSLYQKIESEESIESFVLKNADLVLTKLSNGFTPFHFACYIGKMLSAEYLLSLDKEGYYMSCDGPESMSPLHLAVSRNNVEITKFLLKKGFSPNARCAHGLNALHVACRECAYDCVKVLFSYDMELIDEKTDDGYTPLHFSAYNNDLRTIAFLLQNDVDVDIAAKDKDRSTPIKIAKMKGNKEAEMMIAKSELDDFNLNDAISAIENDDPNKLNNCISSNPDLVYIVDPKTLQTLVHLAFIHNSVKCIFFLKDLDFDLNDHDINWKTPMHFCKSLTEKDSKISQFNEILKFVKFDLSDWEGNTPLSIALDNNNYDVVSTLLQNRANPYSKYKDTIVFFYCATQKELMSSLEIILERNEINVDFIYHGKSALFNAFESKNIKSFNILLKYDANATLDCNGTTVLHKAVMNKDNNFVKKIVNCSTSFNFDIHAKDSEGKEAITIAALYGNEKAKNIIKTLS